MDVDYSDNLQPPDSMARRWARKAERLCCTCATYIPLVFVYGVTTWAVWVVFKIGSVTSNSSWIGKSPPPLGVVAGSPTRKPIHTLPRSPMVIIILCPTLNISSISRGVPS
jgi:hypothetical protein